MSNLNRCSSINTMGHLSLAPSPTTRQLVILTDQEQSYGILATDNNTLALSNNMTALLVNALGTSYPSTLSQLEALYGCTAGEILINFNNDRILSLSQSVPAKQDLLEYTVNPGEAINPDAPSDSIIHAQYAGRVLCFKIGPIRVYIYFSFTPLSTINPTTCTTNGDYAVANYGEFGNSIYPIPAKSALGANCNACGICGGCGACGACALCGGINYGAAAIALVAVDAALALTSALSTFATSIN